MPDPHQGSPPCRRGQRHDHEACNGGSARLASALSVTTYIWWSASGFRERGRPIRASCLLKSQAARQLGTWSTIILRLLGADQEVPA